MLTIVTGLPGSAKTCYSISEIFRLYADRQIYVHNIDGLDHDHFGTIEIDDPEKWYEVPKGGVVVIDEAQTFFPLRKAGSPVPKKCSKFETHRHDGHDVVLITQDATLLDVHIRKLAGKHFHLKRLFGTETSTVFEYNKFEPKPEDRNTIKKCISNNVWKFDKSVYDYYHSAEVHTVKRKIPFKILMVPVIVVVSIGVLVGAIFLLKGIFTKDRSLINSVVSGAKGETAAVTSSAAVVYQKGSLEEWVFKRKPLVEGLPWTAPLYRDAQEIVTYPKPHCIIYGQTEDHMGTCQCYSQQITKMDVGEFICRQLTVHGWFDPTKDDQQGRDRSAPRDPRPAETPVRPNRRGTSPAAYRGRVRYTDVR